MFAFGSTAQAVATVGLTLTAVINFPEAVRTAGHATWVCQAIALVAILLVAETLVLFRRLGVALVLRRRGSLV